MRREERVTVQGPVKEQQPDGITQGGVWGATGAGRELGARRARSGRTSYVMGRNRLASTPWPRCASAGNWRSGSGRCPPADDRGHTVLARNRLRKWQSRGRRGGAVWATRTGDGPEEGSTTKRRGGCPARRVLTGRPVHRAGHTVDPHTVRHGHCLVGGKFCCLGGGGRSMQPEDRTAWGCDEQTDAGNRQDIHSLNFRSLLSVIPPRRPCSSEPMAKSHKPPLVGVPCYPLRTDLAGQAAGHIPLFSIHGLQAARDTLRVRASRSVRPLVTGKAMDSPVGLSHSYKGGWGWGVGGLPRVAGLPGGGDTCFPYNM